MELAIPIRLIIDISTLSATTTREWLGFSRIGECCLPHVVYEEIRFLYERSPDPDLERVAREFNRFYAHSGWMISDVVGHHSTLKAATGHNLTKRARIALAVARCAYGEAQQNPRYLVVLVTSDRTILQRTYDLQMSNLTGIPSSGLLQWSRNGERPVAVTQKLQQLRDMGSSLSGIPSQSYRPTTPVRTRHTDVPGTDPNPSITRLQSNPTRIQSNTEITSPKRHTKVSKYVSPMPEWLPQLMSILSAFAALAVAGGIIWVMFFTSYLNRFLPKEETSPQSTVTTTVVAVLPDETH